MIHMRGRTLTKFAHSTRLRVNQLNIVKTRRKHWTIQVQLESRLEILRGGDHRHNIRDRRHIRRTDVDVRCISVSRFQGVGVGFIIPQPVLGRFSEGYLQRRFSTEFDEDL